MSHDTSPPKVFDVPPVTGPYAEPWSLRRFGLLLASFGPAAICASVSIGAGETIVVVRTGAWAHYSLLWLVLLSCLVKGVFVTYLIGRYTAVSGEPLPNRLARLPGPRGWVLLLIVALEMIGAPIAWTAIAKPCGMLFVHLLQRAVSTPAAGPWPDADVSLWQNIFSSALVLLALGLGLGVSFSRLEKQQIAICGILVAGTIVGTLLTRPDFGAAAAGTFIPDLRPEPVPWMTAEARNFPWLNLATVFAYVGNSVMGYVVYANWVSLHRWGMTGHPKIGEILEHARTRDRVDYLPDDAGAVRRMRLHLSPLRWDVGLGALVLFIVTAAFMMSGAVLYQQRTEFEGWALLTEQAYVWNAIHPALIWVYYVTIIAALWGTLQALPEIYTRVTQSFFQAVWPEHPWEFRRLQRVIVVIVGVPTLVLIWSSVDFDLLTQLAGFILTNLAVTVMMLATLYLNWKLPRPYRTRWFMALGGVLSLLVLTVAAWLSGAGLLRRLMQELGA